MFGYALTDPRLPNRATMSDTTSNSLLPTGAIAGIVVPVFVILIIVTAIVLVKVKKYHVWLQMMRDISNEVITKDRSL